MKKYLLILFLFPAFVFAQEEWKYVGINQSQVKYYIKNVVKKDNGKLTVWVKMVLSTDIRNFNKNSFYQPGEFIVEKWKIDCIEGKLIQMVAVTYDKLGKVRNNDIGPFEEQIVIPDSIAEGVVIDSCKKIQ